MVLHQPRVNLLDSLAKYIRSQEIERKEEVQKVAANMDLRVIERLIRKQNRQTKENIGEDMINILQRIWRMKKKS